MISKRLIPQFLLKGNRLVKGTNFKNYIDVGDPLSQAMIYDAQGAEEIIIVDIKASEEKRLIDLKLINKIINICRLPIAVGGGIKRIEDARKCFQAGADKIVINTAAVINPIFIKRLADEFGSQSIIFSLDIKLNPLKQYEIYINSGKSKINISLDDLLKKVLLYGAGEIMATSINREGTLKGFDYNLYKKLRTTVKVPLIASGGAGFYEDIVKLFRETNVDACTLGKMLFLRDYDIIRIKSYLKWRNINVRDS